MYQIINKRLQRQEADHIYDELSLMKYRIENTPDAVRAVRTFSRKASAERIKTLTSLEDRIGTRLRSLCMRCAAK